MKIARSMIINRLLNATSALEQFAATRHSIVSIKRRKCTLPASNVRADGKGHFGRWTREQVANEDNAEDIAGEKSAGASRIKSLTQGRGSH